MILCVRVLSACVHIKGLNLIVILILLNWDPDGDEYGDTVLMLSWLKGQSNKNNKRTSQTTESKSPSATSPLYEVFPAYRILSCEGNFILFCGKTKMVFRNGKICKHTLTHTLEKTTKQNYQHKGQDKKGFLIFNGWKWMYI